MSQTTNEGHSQREGITVLVPAYNEELAIGKVLEEIQTVLEQHPELDWEILVVNDGSSDRTGEIARAAGARVVDHNTNLGYGASLKTGIRRSSYELIVTTDADGTYPASRIPDLVEAMATTEMAVGARTGERVQIPALRRPAKWCLRKLAEYLTGVEIPDLNSGLRCFRKHTVLELLHLLPNNFSFTTTITLAYHQDARLVTYIPIDYEKRIGTSKIQPIQNTYGFFLLILRTVMYFDPMRVFMPPALVSLLITIATFSWDVLVAGNLAEKSLIWLLITVYLFGIALLGDLVVRRS